MHPRKTLYAWGRSSVGEHLLCKQGVAGSNPAVSTKTNHDKGLRAIGPHESPPDSPEKADVPPLADAIAAFLISRQVANCTLATVRIYSADLGRFLGATQAQGLEEVTPLVVQRHLAGLQGAMKAVSVHQHFRALRTFFGWCVVSGLLADTPMRGLTMKEPKTLPRIPEDDTIRRLLAPARIRLRADGTRPSWHSWPTAASASVKHSGSASRM